MFCTFLLQNARFATAACIFLTSELTKVVPTHHVFYIFTSKCAFRHRGVHFSNIRTYKVVQTRHVLYILTSECAFRHSGVQFFDIWTSKSGPRPSVFLAFSLQKVLFATAACNFWCLLWAAPSAPAVLTGLLFDWPDTRIIEKTQHFATSLTFGADVSSFFGLFALVHLFTFDVTACLICFFNSPYCRKFAIWTSFDEDKDDDDEDDNDEDDNDDDHHHHHDHNHDHHACMPSKESSLAASICTNQWRAQHSHLSILLIESAYSSTCSNTEIETCQQQALPGEFIPIFCPGTDHPGRARAHAWSKIK